jgi:pimeloyl-ACP methyl ester carboxylesterase
MSDETDLRASWFERDGARLFVVESGRGRPVVLLHGGLATHLACQSFAAPLAQRCRLITPDLRGSGRSVDARPLGWDQLADDVAGLLRHLGLARAVIGGISFGAGCAVRVALRHPALVEALVLLTPAYGGAALGLTAAQAAAMAAMDAAGRRTLTEGAGALRPLFAALPAEIRQRACALSATYDPGSVAASTRFMASAAQPFTTGAELASITAPVLLVPGEDPTHPLEVAEVYRRHLPRCTVRSVGPKDFAAVIAELIAELDQSSIEH